MTELRCSRCLKLKNPDAFYRHSGIRRGRQYVCKTCTRHLQAEYRQTDTYQVASRRYRTRTEVKQRRARTQVRYARRNAEVVRRYNNSERNRKLQRVRARRSYWKRRNQGVNMAALTKSEKQLVEEHFIIMRSSEPMIGSQQRPWVAIPKSGCPIRYQVSRRYKQELWRECLYLLRGIERKEAARGAG